MATPLDLLVYHDMTDTFDQSLEVGDSAGEKFGEKFHGLYVVATGAGIHPGRRTVVLASEHRPEMAQDLKRYFGS